MNTKSELDLCIGVSRKTVRRAKMEYDRINSHNQSLMFSHTSRVQMSPRTHQRWVWCVIIIHSTGHEINQNGPVQHDIIKVKRLSLVT